MMLIKLHIKSNNLDFSGVPVVETSPFSAGDVGFIPRVSWPKNHCNKFSKGFKKKVHIKKIFKKGSKFLVLIYMCKSLRLSSICYPSE